MNHMKSSRPYTVRQSERSSNGRWRTCFIAASPRTNLETIKTLLSERGIRPVLVSELPPYGGTLLDQVAEAISEADLLIAVLDAKPSNASRYFEIAYAHALRKRILILAAPELPILPRYIREMLYIRADPQNREAIDFALDQTLAGPRPTKPRPSRRVREGRPIGALADELIEELQSIGDRVTERDLERVVELALTESGILFVPHTDQPDAGVDLVIWAEELNSWVGNPFLIEIKKELGSQLEVRTLIDQLSLHLQDGIIRGALVIYARGPSRIAPYLPLDLASCVLFVGIGDLFEMLRLSSFGQAVLELRNRWAHGGRP